MNMKFLAVVITPPAIYQYLRCLIFTNDTIVMSSRFEEVLSPPLLFALSVSLGY